MYKRQALIVGGGQDSIAGAGGSIILGRNLPNSRTEIFQDSEHGVYRHKQAEFRKLVLEFCKNIQVIN